MRRVQPPLGLICPGCGADLEPTGEQIHEVQRLHCLDCGEIFQARRRSRPPLNPSRPAMGGVALSVRVTVLRLVPLVYRLGVGLGSVAMLSLGGFVPVIKGWLDDKVTGTGEVIELLGGIRVAPESRDPDNDFGPLIRRQDAPRLFDEVADVARRLGVRPPEEIRMAFLPCCGVVAWRHSRALLLGLPLLHALTIAELRSVLGHEMAHLAGGDATSSAGSLRFVEGLGRALDDESGRSWGPLRFWAGLCRSLSRRLIGPIARGQEARADRVAASIAGGSIAASALIKVAIVQPLFRELLEYRDSEQSDAVNLYANFKSLWARLPESFQETIRLRLLTVDPGTEDSPHPPLPERVAMIQSYPERPGLPEDNASSATLVGDPEWLEQLLHDRLFGLAAVEPTVFHKSGS